MLKVGIIGCGKIADAHASQIQRVAGCEIVGACDREELMAQQFCDRFGVKAHFSEVEELLKQSQPDVVHITTPPQSHFEISRQCLRHGCHVYVEKPFTLTASDAEALIALAEEMDLKLTAGHDLQYSHAARRMRRLVRDGYLGGPPLHMESYYCYELGDPSYAKALLADSGHWVRRLPGKLLHNLISHGIARLAEFLASESPQVIAHGFTSPLLRSLGETEIVDELRVIINADNRQTAGFTFSSQIHPSLNQFRLYGSKNGLVLDQNHETLIKFKGARHKSYLEQFVPPASLGGQYFGNLSRNMRSFLANDFHPKSGMKYLIEAFYGSITQNQPVPIPYREIVLTARIMDSIFQQLYPPSRTGSPSDSETKEGEPTPPSVGRRT